MMGRIKNILIIAILLYAGAAYAQPGTVVSVTDGDTIKVMIDGVQTKIRLYGIDAPEKKQAFGQAAKQFTVARVAGKQVDVEPVATDRYGRTVGIVTYDGHNLQAELVRAGMAWVYPQYCQKLFCKDWAAIEQAAMAGKVGLWVDPTPVPPWAWRRQEK